MRSDWDGVVSYNDSILIGLFYPVQRSGETMLSTILSLLADVQENYWYLLDKAYIYLAHWKRKLPPVYWGLPNSAKNHEGIKVAGMTNSTRKV